MKMIVSLGNYCHKCDAARKVLSSLNFQSSMVNGQRKTNLLLLASNFLTL